MIKEIKYNGYSANPSDYECADGELATSMGLIPEDGAMKPVLPPSVKLQLNEDETVKFIHQTSAYTHYIVYSDTTRKVYSIDEDTGTKLTVGSLGYTMSHFNAIGNTLLVFTTNGIYYFLWKDSAYMELGNHIPDVEMSFGLVGRPRLFSLSDESKSTFSISFDGISEGALYNELSESNKTKITDQIMAKVNKFVAQETVNKGRFCFPFFVRYALKLYDGSLVYHSAPILMNPSTKAAPIVFWKRASGKGSYTSAECDIMLVAASLDYRVIRNIDSYYLEDWKDIVKSIEVFISKPIYTYDQNGQISSFADTDNYTTKFIGRLYATNPSTTVTTRAEDKLLGSFGSKEFLDYYCEWEYSSIYAMYYSSDRSYPSTTFALPEFSEGKVIETLQNTSTFYKLCSIDIEDSIADNNRKDIVVDDEYLQSLVTREVMTDDYLTRDQLYADYSFVYNSRINLAGLRRKPFQGFLAQSMFAYCNSRYNWELSGTTLNITIAAFSTDSYSMAVYIKENGEDYRVECTTDYYDKCYLALFNSSEYTDGRKSKHSWGCYLFYPNPNAYKIVIYNYASACYAVDLKPHEFLNGAFAILDYELVREKNFTSLPNISYPMIPNEQARIFPIEISNKIYTSEVNNPFYFPLLGINTVGTGNILGICAAAKALSEGQFGQFPLYAFTTEGVWAMEVSATGGYSAKQPITRDVVLAKGESITQIDSAVLFATNRGIMMLSGSESICISDILDSADVFSPSKMHSGDILATLSGLNSEQLHFIPFRQFLQGCRMTYDYNNQRIIVFNPECRYAFVYSLKDKKWGMRPSDLYAAVNSYPEALATTTDNKLVNISLPNKDDISSVKGLLITRPLKLDDGDVLKTVDTVIQRGYFRQGHVKQILYGSNDLFHWFTIWSSNTERMRGFSGTPYKYFRIAVICDLNDDESITGCTISYNQRRTNKLR